MIEISRSSATRSSGQIGAISHRWIAPVLQGAILGSGRHFRTTGKKCIRGWPPARDARQGGRWKSSSAGGRIVFKIDVVDDQDGYAGQRSDLALGAAGGASGGLRAIRGVGGRKCCSLPPLGSTALRLKILATRRVVGIFHLPGRHAHIPEHGRQEFLHPLAFVHDLINKWSPVQVILLVTEALN